MVDLVERLDNLFDQEKKHYGCPDYLSPEYHEKLVRDLMPEVQIIPASEAASTSSSTASAGKINDIWREKICEWSYQVVDHFDFSREVVSISMCYLDRFLSTRTVDKKLFQLSAMTTLYLAIKLYEPKTITMASMIELSRGFFMVEQMASMEREILNALNWHVHPPTTIVFARHMLHGLPSHACTPNARHDILELARFLTELSVCDYFFVNKKASSIGLAALLNAMEMSNLRQSSVLSFLHFIKIELRQDPEDIQVKSCQERLHELYKQGGYHQDKEIISKDTKEESSHRPAVDRDTVSPVCVGTTEAF